MQAQIDSTTVRWRFWQQSIAARSGSMYKQYCAVSGTLARDAAFHHLHPFYMLQ